MADPVDYGASGASFGDTAAKFAAQSRQRQEIVRREGEARRQSASVESQAERDLAAARQESVSVAERENAVAGVQSPRRKVNIADIQAEAAARRENTVAMAQETAAMEEQAAAQTRQAATRGTPIPMTPQLKSVLRRKYATGATGSELSLWQTAMGGDMTRRPGVVPVGVTGSFSPGGPTITTEDPKTFAAYAKESGALKEAQAMQRRAAQAAKVAAREEAAAAAAVPVAPPPPPPPPPRKPPAPPAGGGPPEEPPGPPLGPYGPQTRLQSAINAKAVADSEYVKASRAYTVSLRGSDAGLQSANLARKLQAQDIKGEAAAEVKAAQAADVASRERIQAAQVAARERATPTANQYAYPLGPSRGPLAYVGAERARGIDQHAYPIGPIQGPLALRGRGGGPGGPGEPPAPPIDPAWEVAAQHQAKLENESAGAVMRANVARREASATFNELDTSMYRHGALTSEFIAATLKGETSIRELGSQVLITTGKFAGWTAAAAGVYGLIGIFGKLKDGITEAQNGATNLSRFIEGLDKNQAISGFQSTSQAVNVPISEVADATSSFARVSHDLASAQQAARASLILTKLDNITAADSYRTLTATVLGYKLSVSDVPAIVDRINMTQRRFGARSGEIVAGLARAAGPVGQSGMSYEQTIAALGTGILAGQTGTVVGNALARSATTFVHKPNQQAILETFGLNPNQPYGQLFQQAMTMLQQHQYSSEQIRELAQGFGGPQLGSRVFTGLFSNPQRYQSMVDRPVGPGEHATDELKIKLQSVSEQAHSVGIALENWGASIAKSGVLAGVAKLLQGLAGVFHMVTGISNAFGGMSDPLKLLLGGGALVGGARFLSGRFAGGGGGLLSHIPGMSLLTRGDAQLQRGAVLGTQKEAEQLRNAQEQYASARRDATIEQTSIVTAKQGYINTNRPAATAPLGSAERVAYQDALIGYSDQERQATRAAAVAAEQERGARAAKLAVDEQITNLQKASADNVARSVRFNDFQRMSQAERSAAVVASREQMSRRFGFGNTSSFLPVGTVGPLTREQDAMQRGLSRAGLATESTIQAMQVRMRNAGLPLGGAVLGDRVVNVASRAAAGAVSNTERAFARMRSVDGGLRSIPGKMQSMLGGFVQSLGFLDLAFAAFAAYSIISPMIDGWRARINSQLQAAAKGPQNAQDLRRAASGADLRGAQSKLGLGPVNVARNALMNVSDVVTGRAFRSGYEDDAQKRLDLILEQQGNQQRAVFIAAQQARERTTSGPVANQYLGDIQGQMQKGVQDYKSGVISFSQLQSDFNKHALEIHHSVFIDQSGIAQGMQALAAAKAQVAKNSGDYISAIQQMSDKQLQTEIDTQVRDVKGYGSGSPYGRTALGKLTAIQGNLFARAYAPQAGQSATQDQINSFAQANDKITQAIQQTAQNDLKIGLSLAQTERERQAAFEQAIGIAEQQDRGVRQGYSGAVQRYQRALKKQADAQRAFNSVQNKMPQLSAGPVNTFGGQPGNPLDPNNQVLGTGFQTAVTNQKSAQDNYDKLLQQAKGTASESAQLKKNLDQARKQLGEANRAKDAAVADLRSQQYQDYSQGVDVNAAFAVSRTSDTLQQDAIKVAAARRKVAYALARFHQGSREYKQAMTDLNTTLQSQAQDVTDIQDAAFQAQSAGESGDAMAQAVTKLKQAAYDMSRARGPKAYQSALAAYRDAQYQAAQQAQAQHDARLDYLSSLTTDPLKKDQYDIQKAHNDIKGTKPGTAENYKALATLNDARSKYVDDKASSRESDIQFQLDMNQITTQEAVADLQHLLRLGNLSKQRRQEIQGKIHQLQKQGSAEASGFDLDVGSGVKLPTAYDVHRAFAGIHDSIKNTAAAATSELNHLQAAGHRPGAAGVTGGTQAPVSLSMTVYVQKGGDEHKVYDAIDRALKTHSRARAKSLGRR